MSALLLNESPLLVMPTLACKIGLNESIVLQQLHYWLVNAEKKGEQDKFFDGQWWTYSSYGEWREKNFPFWSERTIKRTIANLEKRGLVRRREEANLQAKGGSRTWYSIDYLQLEAVGNGPGYGQVVTTPPDKLSPPLWTSCHHLY